MLKKTTLFLFSFFLLGLLLAKSAMAVMYCEDPDDIMGVWDYETRYEHIVTAGKELKTGWDHKVKLEVDSSVLGNDAGNVKFQVGNDPRWVDAGFHTASDTYRIDHRPVIDESCGTVYANASWLDDQGKPHSCYITNRVLKVKTSINEFSLPEVELAGGHDTLGVMLREYRDFSFTLNDPSASCYDYKLNMPDGSLMPVFNDNGACRVWFPGDTSYMVYPNQDSYQIGILGDQGKIGNITQDFAFEVLQVNQGNICGGPRHYYGNTQAYGYVMDEDTNQPIAGAKVSAHYKQNPGDIDYTYGQDAVSNEDGYWSLSIFEGTPYYLKVVESNSSLCHQNGRDPQIPAAASIINVNEVGMVYPPKVFGPITFYDKNCQQPEVCSLAQEQIDGWWSGIPLVNNYLANYGSDFQYGTFTATQTGAIDKIEILTSLDRNVAIGNKVLTCKVTDNLGNLISTSDPNTGPFSQNTYNWLNLDFSNRADVVAGQDYKIYCKVDNLAGGGYIYWRRGPLPILKSFKIDMCW
jgi:hypothetical protein